MPAHILRIVGPSGAGKSLFATSMQEALRHNEVRSAWVVSSGPGITTIAISAGGRSTLERDVPLSFLPQVISWIDPAVELILAEGYDETGAPAVEIRPEGALPHPIPEDERYAVVAADVLAQQFAERGPGYTAGVAEQILREWLDRKPKPLPNVAEEMDKRMAHLAGQDAEPEGGALRRLLGRFRR